jgi:hypothetical protein
VIITGPILPEPVEIVAVQQYGAALKISGRGLQTNQFISRVFSPDQLAQITVAPAQLAYAGSRHKERQTA